MEECGVKPDVITFSTIMNQWSSTGLMKKCQEVFNNMVKVGIEPDVHAFSILAKGYVRAREPGKAESLLTSMTKYGLHPNVVIFTTIISGWCNAGKMERALRLLEKMYEMDVPPTLRTFETLLWGYGEAKQPWKAEELLQLMEEKGVPPENSTVKLVVEAWRSIGLLSEAERFLNEEEEREDDEDKEMDEAPLEILETIYKKKHLGASYSNILQVPGVVVTNTENSSSANIRSQMAWKQMVFTSESMKNSTKSILVSYSSRFGVQPMIICKKQFQSPFRTCRQFVNTCRMIFIY